MQCRCTIALALGALGVHREMQERLLRRRVAGHVHAVGVDLGDARRIEPAERAAGRRHEDAVVDAHAEIARAAVRVAAVVERPAALDERFAQRCSFIAAPPSPWRRNRAPPKLPDLSASQNGSPPTARVHGTPGSISGPMASARTPSASTTAPEVSPPATTKARTPARRQRRGDACETPSSTSARRALGAERRLRRGNLVRRRGRVDEHGPSPTARRRPAAAIARRRPGSAGERERVEPERRAPLRAPPRPAGAWPRSSCRTATRPGRGGGGVVHAPPPACARSRSARARPSASPAPPVVSGRSTQARRPRPGARRASRPRSRARSLRRQAPRAARARRRRPRPRRHRHEPDLARRLRREHADEVGVGHRRQRMVAHARVGQQDVADEQVAAIDRAPVARIRGRRGRRHAAGATPARCCSASVTGPMLPRGVESNVEQYLK